MRLKTKKKKTHPILRRYRDRKRRKKKPKTIFSFTTPIIYVIETPPERSRASESWLSNVKKTNETIPVSTRREVFIQNLKKTSERVLGSDSFLPSGPLFKIFFFLQKKKALILVTYPRFQYKKEGRGRSLRRSRKSNGKIWKFE